MPLSRHIMLYDEIHPVSLYNKILASEGKIVYNVLNMIIMGVVPTEGKLSK